MKRYMPEIPDEPTCSPSVIPRKDWFPPGALDTFRLQAPELPVSRPAKAARPIDYYLPDYKFVNQPPEDSLDIVSIFANKLINQPKDSLDIDIMFANKLIKGKGSIDLD